MTVTELALLRLKPTITPTNASLLANLRKAKIAMENYTGNKFYFKQDREDPAQIYIIGEWPSVEHHWKEWIPCAENKELVESLTPYLDVEWMWHVDVPQKNLPLDENAVSIGRLSVMEGKKEAFEKEVTQASSLDGGVNFGGGWRMEKEGGSAEWVLFSGSENEEDLIESTKLEKLKDDGKLSMLIEQIDIRHVRGFEV